MLFMLLTSFSQQEEKIKVVDSATVKFQMDVQFEKPNIGVTINDDRNSDSFVRLMDIYTENDSEVAEAIRETNAYTQFGLETQERRYKETTLDQLSRDTGYSIDQINSFISKKRRHGMLSSVVLLCFLVGGWFYITFDAHKNGKPDWRYLIIKTMAILLVTIGVYKACILILGGLNPDLQRFYELLKLSG